MGGNEDHLEGRSARRHPHPLLLLLALLLTACGGGGGGGGADPAGDTTLNTVVVAGSVAAIDASSLAAHALATNVTVVAVDERGFIADSETTRDRFSLTLATGHDYLIAFRVGPTTGPTLAALVVDEAGSGRALFTLASGAPDIDLGAITLHRATRRAVSDQPLAGRLPRPATAPPDRDGNLMPDRMDRDDDNDGTFDSGDCLPLSGAGAILLADGSTCVADDGDDDNDGVPDVGDAFPLDPTEAIDTDGDGTGNHADLDDDGDGTLDAADCAPLDPTGAILLADGSTCVADDGDDDNDGVADAGDAFPLDPTEAIDTDGDGTGNHADLDDDGDGTADATDCAPLDPAGAILLADGSTCVADDGDDDNDGVPDASDAFPLDPTEAIDTDGDGTGNHADLDDDGDGTLDAADCAPLDPAGAILLADGSTCVADDGDDDNDGVPDASDAFPLDPTEAIDTDGDGTGNHADLDDDGDGTLDTADCAPLDPTRQVLAGGNCVAQAGSASLSGTLLVSTVGQPGETAVTEREPNDTALTAQFLGPLTPDLSYRVAGALAPPDPQDVYWLTESIAQRVRVTLTHGAGVDFDLEVYDVGLDGTLTSLGKSALTTSPDEVIYDTPAPLPGDSYITAIVVVPWSGTGDYQLTIQAAYPAGGTAVATAGKGERRAVASGGNTRPPRPIDEVWDVSDLDAVPGEVLVKLRPAPAGAVQALAVEGWRGLTPCGGVTGVATLLCDPGGAAVQAAALSPADREAALRRTVAQLLYLRADPRVAEAIPNYLLHPSVVPDDPYYHLQWHYPQIGLPEAWEITTGDPDVIVAVLDTGITAHPDLAGRVIGGYDFVSGLYAAADGTGRDPDPTDPGNGDGTSPSSWHGTHVAGTIGAATDNGTGVAGVDWGCRIMPVRVLGRGGGTITDILEGIKYAAGLPNASGAVPPQRADIINMSLGGYGSSNTATITEQTVYDQARAAGVLLVAAAGNNGSDWIMPPIFPAAAANVLSVAAVDNVGNRAPYSYFGPTVDIAAPGGNLDDDRNGDGWPDGVLSTLVSQADGSFIYDTYQGTSMAAPHVAGVAALVLAANPTLTVDQLEALLLSTATDLGTPGRDDLYGHGLVNAAAAVQQAAGGMPSPTLEVSPAVLNFGTTETTLEVALTNTGIETVFVDPPSVTTTDGHPWLSATLTPTTATPVVVEVDRTGLAPGRYAGRVAITSTGGDRTVEVSMEVSAAAGLPEVGTVWVRLVDPTGATAQEVQTTVAGGYAYTFADLPAGSYTLLASTDGDGDGVLCEAGEFCGAYPVLGEPVAIEVVAGATVAGINFAVTYQGSGVGPPPPDNPPVDPEVALLTPLLGEWAFSFTIISTFTDFYTLEVIDPGGGDPILVGRDLYGGLVVADVVTSPPLGYAYSLYDPGSLIDAFYLFDLDPGGDTVTGEYWQIDAATGELPPWPYPMAGVRLPLGTLSATAMGAAEAGAREAAAVRAAAHAPESPVDAAHQEEVQRLYDAARGRW